MSVVFMCRQFTRFTQRRHICSRREHYLYGGSFIPAYSSSFNFFLNKLFFYSSFKFTAKWNRRHRDFSIYALSHQCANFSWSIPTSQSGTFVTTNEPTLMCHQYPKPILCIRVQTRCCTFYRFGHIYNDIYPLS